MKISCKLGEPSWCSFPESVNASTRSDGVVNAKLKYPPPVDTTIPSK